MARPHFIFGGDTGVSSPEELKRLRAIADALGGPYSPSSIAEGLSAVGAALGGRIADGRASKMASAGEASRLAAMNPITGALFGGSFPEAPKASETAKALAGVGPSPNSPAGGARAAAEIQPDSALPASFLAAVDRSEGGGDYNTLFGHAQREGNRFAGTRVSDMTIGEALAFADPSGDYGQSVKGQIGRVATPMGRHQIVGTTLRNASQAMGLDPSTPFNAQTQDAIAAHLARQRLAGQTTMDGKIAALRSEWEGFKNVPRAQLEQIINDIEAGPAPSPQPRQPVQVASLDPAAGIGSTPAPTAPAPSTPPQSAPALQVNSRLMAQDPLGGSPMPLVGAPQPTSAPAPAAGVPAQPTGQPAPVMPEPVQQPRPEMSGQSDRPSQAHLIPQIMQAMQNPWLKEGDRAFLASQLQRIQQENSPETLMARRKSEIELRNLEGGQWSKLDDGTLYNQRTGEIRRVAGGGGSMPAELGLNPQYGIDAQGNPVLIQLGKDGRGVQTQLPEGVSLSKEPIRLDAGTHFVLLDPITRQPIGQIEKNLAGAEEQKVIGKTEGEARVAASADMQSAQNALDLIASIREDPNRQRGTGVSANFNWIPGTAGYDFERKVEQAKSGAFMSAIQQLRGMGALSNAEGQTATAAVTRLNTAMTEEGFLEALADYEKIVQQGYDRAANRLQSGSMRSAPTSGGTDYKSRYGLE